LTTDEIIGLVRRLDVDAYVRGSLIHPNDNMRSAGRDEHYYSVGRDALWNVVQSMLAADLPMAQRILDFPSGFGRVARYLRAAFSESELYVGDVWQDAVNDCARVFGAKKIAVTANLRDIVAPKFDLIFCGSLLTHFPEPKSRELLDFFIDHLAVGGIAIVSCSGRKNLQHEATHFNERVFQTRERLQALAEDYYDGRYAFVDYPWQPGYGRSFTPLAWFHSYIGNNHNIAIARFAERGWDDNQDVVTFKRMS
jgi:SAM-dependent methyltransferase